MTAEGSEGYWTAVREAVMEHLDATHQSHLAQLGEEYVWAMRSGARLRELAEANPYSTLKSGRVVSNPLWDAADRDIRRGIQLAKALELHKPRPPAEEDIFADIDGEVERTSSLAAARSRRDAKRGGAA